MAAKKVKKNSVNTVKTSPETSSDTSPGKKSKVKASAVRKKKSNNNKLLMIAAAVIVIIGGVYLMKGGAEKENYDDLNLPSYAYTNAPVLKAYGYTIQNPEVIEKMQCFCGCEGMGHKSLKNCYISDDGVYSSHASNCDVCVGEVIKTKQLYESGLYISEIRKLIDEEYGRKYGGGNGGVPITEDFNINLKAITGSYEPESTPVPVDYSKLELSSNFRSLADGLNMTPQGVVWAQYINMKQASGTPLENYVSDRVQPVGFYGVPLIAMYSTDYSQNNWIEFHDIGYTDLEIQPVSSEGMSNVLVTRPFIYGHTTNVQRARQLIDDPSSMENAYVSYKAVLNGIDLENTVVSAVSVTPNQYADLFYSGLNDAGNGLVQRDMVYHLIPGGESLTSQYETKAANSLANGFTRYDVVQDNDILTITIIGTLENVLNEAL